MKYVGSKQRIAYKILPIILKNRKPNQWYVEPFCGGCNIIDKVSGNRIANDSNQYLISMWKALQNGWIPPDYVNESTYNDVRKNPQNYDEHFVAFVQFGCSFGAKWNGGFARNIKKDTINSDILNRGIKNYCRQSKINILKQLPKLHGVKFTNVDYSDMIIPLKSVIYCDIPYGSTIKYKDDFDHEKFWQWCRDKVDEGHEVFISEYNAPDDFTCIWYEDVICNVGANNKIDKANKKRTERLFTLNSDNIVYDMNKFFSF